MRLSITRMIEIGELLTIELTVRTTTETTTTHQGTQIAKDIIKAATSMAVAESLISLTN